MLAQTLVAPAVFAASPALTVTPLTWNVIGLDSNRPATGPNLFPVGARVCNVGDAPASSVTATFVWDSANAYVSLQSGSLSSVALGAIAQGECADAYFNVEISKTAAAFDTARRYHISATDSGSGATGSTPTPRELYVEHLISQNRNGVDSIKLDGVTIPAGGSMTMLVGGTYEIEVAGHTATQGYNQLESFITLPNTIFQVLAVESTYSADSSVYVDSPNDRLYADACLWENHPASANYRTCVGSDGKAGGTVVTTYTVTVLGGGGTSQALTSLLYDFSGSSYHYNADFSIGSRIVDVVDPSSEVSFAKAFAPSSTTAGGTSTLTFTLANDGSGPVTDANFTDPLPKLSGGQMVVARPAVYSTSGCGSPTFAPVADDSSISFAHGTIAANGTCSASVQVRVPAAPTTGTYNNLSNDLFIGATDTGQSANANLTLGAADPGTGICGQTLASWAFPTGFSTTSPVPTVANVTASAAPGAGIVSVAASATHTADGTVSWGTNGAVATGATLVTTNNDYFEFALDTTGFSTVYLNFWAQRKSNANTPQGIAVYYGAAQGNPETGTSIYSNATALSSPATWVEFGAADSLPMSVSTGTTYVRIYAFNAGNSNPGSDMQVDDVVFTGCGAATQPTLSKSFSVNPIALNGTSTLTFTLTNSNTVALTGAKFSDALPSGLEVAATPAASTTCTNSPTWAPAAAATTLNFGQIIGATIPASSSCTAQVNIKATTAGPHTNVSGFISTTESGTNTGAGGSGIASLLALLPPTIAKSFMPDTILTSGVSLLTITISNPNPSDALSGIVFTDSYPANLTNATPAEPDNNCGGVFTAAHGASSISLSGGSLASGASCTLSVSVTAAPAGSYDNTTGAVSATTAGTGAASNTATLTVNDAAPAISVLKQVSISPSGPWLQFVAVAPGTDLYYKFTVENTGDVNFDPFSVSDPALVGSAADPADCVWNTVNDPSTLPALPVATQTIDPTATCTVGPVAAALGDNPNSATAHGTYDAVEYVSEPSDANAIGAVPGFSLLKQISTSANGPWFSALSVLDGSDVFYKFSLVNTGALDLENIGVDDPTVDTSSCTFTDPLVVGDATICVVGPLTASGAPDSTTVNKATGQGSNSGDDYETDPSSAEYTISATGFNADLSVTKTDGTTTVSSGGSTTYTVTVRNLGPDDVTDATVTDFAPADMTFGNWTCSVTNAGSGSVTTACGAANGSGDLNTTVTMRGGAIITYTVPATIDENASGSLLNTATVTAPDGVSDPVPGNNSASDSDTVLAEPAITLDKSAVPDFSDPVAVGDTIDYTMTATNTGNVNLHDVWISDPLLGALDCDPDQPATLAPDETLECTGSYTLTQADLDAGGVQNEATVDALDPDGGPVSDTDDTDTPIDTAPGLGLDKSTAETSYDEVGDNLTYDFDLTNTGNVTLPGPFTVSDDKIGVFACGAGPLAPGDSTDCQNSYSVSQADLDAGSVTNTASASTSFDGDDVDSNDDDVTVDAVQQPALAMDKSADEASFATVGTVLHYDYELTNTGNVTLAGPFTVSDDKIDNGTPFACGTGPLAPGDFTTCTAEYTTTQADLDAGSVTNTASASTSFDGDDVDSNEDDATVPAVQAPGLGLSKVADESSFDAAGDALNYTYTLTNTGNTTLTGPFTVSDDKIDGGAPFECDTDPLAPGEFTSCTAEYTTTQADVNAGSVTNTATAYDGALESNEDDATVPADQDSELTLVKTADESSFDAAGDALNYNYTLTNTGNTTLEGPLSVSDDKVVGTIACGAGPLAPGDFTTCEASYTVTQADLDDGSVTNTAQGSASFDGDDVESNEDSVTIDADQNPELTLGKQATPDLSSPAQSGDTIDYTLTATNTGNVTLDNVDISDPLLGALDCEPAAPVDLAPGESLECTGSYTVTQSDIAAGSVDNTASASGDDPDDGPVSDEDGASTELEQSASIALVKTADASALSSPAEVGDIISYTLAATNTGNVTLDEVEIVDALLGALDCTPAQPTALAPGDSLECTADYAVTQSDINSGSVDNTATATALDPDDAEISNEDGTSTELEQSASIALVKNANIDGVNSPAQVGDPIDYTLTATNAGNVTLYAVEISDPLLGTLDCTPAQPTALAPGASLVCTGTHALTLADIDAGHVANTATVAATDPDDADVNDEDSSDTDLDQNPAITLDKQVNDSALSSPAEVGDILAYTLTATNTGNVTLDEAEISDALLGALDCDLVAPVTLAPGDSLECTASYAITQSDIDAGTVDNTATATALDPDDVEASDEDGTSTALEQSASVELVKIANSDALSDPAQVGETISYTLTATNTGNVTLDEVEITDALLGALDCDPIQPTSLAPGESLTCTGDYTLTLTDINAGHVANTATASALDPDDGPVSDEDSTDTELTKQPELDLVKTADASALSSPAEVGDIISYTLAATNTGNVSLDDVEVVDALLGTLDCDLDAPVTLAPAETLTCTGSYAVTQADIDAGSVDNTASTSASAPDDSPLSDADEASVELGQLAELTITKDVSVDEGQNWLAADSAPGPDIDAGQAVEFRYIVTNTGDVTLTDIEVSDDQEVVVSCDFETLAPAASMTCTGSDFAVAGQYTNIGTASATSPNEEYVEDSDSANYLGGAEGVVITNKDVEVNNPIVTGFTRDYDWTVTKEVDQSSGSAAAGESVTFRYSITVTQSGQSDSGWEIDGEIDLTNGNATDLVGVDVTDTVNNGGTCAVENGQNVTIPAGQTVILYYHCDWASEPSSLSGVSTATATWDAIVNNTNNSSASSNENFSFGAPTNPIDGMVTVTDSMAGDLGPVSSAEETFEYAVDLAAPESGCTDFDNTVTLSSGAADTVTVSVCNSLNPPPDPSASPDPLPTPRNTSGEPWVDGQGGGNNGMLMLVALAMGVVSLFMVMAGRRMSRSGADTRRRIGRSGLRRRG